MSEKLIPFNRAQLTGILMQSHGHVDIHGRGTGKSFGIGFDIHRNNTIMPRSVTGVTGNTYAQLLTRTLPSSFKFLEKLGYVNGIHYVIRNKPPKHFRIPYEQILSYENFISFVNGTGYLLMSQDRAGSSRGPNIDFEIVDEALTINKERYDAEVGPTNRGNLDIWGPKSGKPLKMHHGFHYVSSMPTDQSGKWLLDYAKYYEEEAGIRLFEIWNKIVRLQLELLEIENPKEFASLWNEIQRLRRKITPFVSKDGIVFTIANSFDNLDAVGFSYIKQEYKKLTLMVFLIEIMNMIMDKVQDCYYQIIPERHVYYNAYEEGYIRDLAENTNYDFKRLSNHDCRYDKDCNLHQPLEIVPDWGAAISLFVVCQERNFDFVRNEFSHKPVHNYIKEFFAKPDVSKKDIVINELVDQFCHYYQSHQKKELIYYRDRYGDNKLPNSSKSFNEQAMERLEKNGWNVTPLVHSGIEPPHHDKYLLWGNVLIENNEKFPWVRFNGNNCPYLLISMNNTEVIEGKDGKFEKNKKSERKDSGVPPEEATHFSDAADKILWSKYGTLLTYNSTFVPARF